MPTVVAAEGAVMEQETYLERIKKLKSSRKITNDKLSEMTGIPLGTLAKLLAGISDSPKLSNIVAISRALDCSLDWLITGVPENTHNYTLSEEEITLVETYRELDHYGQALALAVLDMERARAERQADEEAIRLHDAARRTARRGAPRLRRPDEGAPVTPAEEVAAPASLTAADLIRGGGESAPAEVTVASATVASATMVDSAAPAASAEPAVTAIPRSFLSGSGALPAGLRRRSIGLYDMPVSAGVGEFLADASRIEDIVIPDDPRTAEADFALRINGDSMEPKYRSGDVLLIQSADTVEEGELGIFVLDGAGYFKKYGGDRLISLNPLYPPILLKDFADVGCCGRVVGKLKKK